MHRRLSLTLLIVTCALAAAGPARAGDRVTGSMFVTRSEVLATRGMVATSQPLAAQVGLEVLRRGGTAVDAAIAVNAALGLMEPTGCGIGGDLFALVWDAGERKLYGLNASGPAPQAHTPELFAGAGLRRVPARGPLSWTVPGCVAGWFALHGRFGRLPMAEVLAPAVAYAERGFPVTELIAHYWARSVALFAEQANFQALYAPDGRVPGKGDIFRNPELAETYRILARDGAEAFYRGPLAERLVAYSVRAGGHLALADLAEFEVEWVEPVSVPYRGVEVWQLPPNTQGLAVLQMLRLLEGFDLRAMGHNSADYLHTLVEMKKIVYEDRARHYADPRFAPAPVAALLDPAYTAERRKLFDPRRAARELAAGDPVLAAGDTVYLAVADEAGNVVSLIQSNYMGFGSGNVPDGLGFCLQNRGALFSLEADHPNRLAPGKRPFHTIIPGFATRDGEALFAFGVMGGDMQPQGHVQILCNILDFGMNIQEAGDVPRFCHEGSSTPEGDRMTDGGVLKVESGVAPEVLRELAARGHRVQFARDGFGGYQGIWLDAARGVRVGGSESRKDGCAVGY